VHKTNTIRGPKTNKGYGCMHGLINGGATGETKQTTTKIK